MAFVNVYKLSTPENPSPNGLADRSTAMGADSDTDVDLQRANDLISLHYTAKLEHVESDWGADLIRARADVDAVLSALTRQT